MIKSLFLFFFSICAISLMGQHEGHQSSNATNSKSKSPRNSAMANVKDNHVHIDFGSPSVRGRAIWNGLVAYDQVWATGAHKATWIDFSHDVKIQGQKISKGKYGFFTIPKKDKWILIISKDWNMHLADDYNQKSDIVRVEVTPVKNKEITESLTYEVLDRGNGKGSIKMSWEFLSVMLEFENN